MPGYPCCCNTCTIYIDTFDRPNANQLGEFWVDNGTQFSIEDNAAKPNSSFAIAILDVEHPVPDESMHVIITTKDEVNNSGTRYRVILNSLRTSNPTSYYFAEFERNGINDSILRLGICSNNVETILAQDVVLGLVDDKRQIEARLADYEFCATVSNSTVSYVGTVPPQLFQDGFYCGMSVYSSAARIDDITFKEHYKTNENCAYCNCKCDTTVLPPILNVCIYPVPSNCTRLDLLHPCCFQLYWNRIDSVWKGQGLCCQSYTYNTGQLWEITVACPTNFEDPYTMIATILQGCTNSCTNCQGALVPVEADCNPFKLRYGPFRVTELDLTCFCSSSSNIFGRGFCDYYIEITI